MKRFLASFVILAVATVLHAEVVEDTNITLSAGFSLQYGLTLGQDPQNSDFTCAEFDWDGGNVDGHICVDEGAEWFVAEDGDEFSAATVGEPGFDGFPNSQFPKFFGAQLSFLDGDEFFIATATPILESATLPDAYGWAKLRVNGTGSAQTLEMVDNAVAYGAPGIFIGTSEIVPEPNAAALGLIAATIIPLYWRRRQQSR